MFKRYAMSAISVIDTKGNKRVAFENTDKSVVSFEYDPENFVYFRCRAITADAANGNGDFFPEDELRKAYKTFIGVGMYKDHDSDSVDKSVGKVLWAEWVPEGKYVECYCCVDRKLEADLARRIEMGQANTVSMGCMVGEAICSVAGCGNVAHNQLELCEHMTPGRGIKGKRGTDGKVAYEINKLLQFTELSLVTVPADPTAHIFEVFAKLKAGGMSDEEARRIVREEITSMVGTVTADILMKTAERSAEKVVASATAQSVNSSPVKAVPAQNERETVAKIPDSTEKQMKLAISYERGENLANSFFVAKEANAEFRVAAADVLPVIVQEAIRTKQPGVATPMQIVADLSEKCPSLADFKKWAKKRKKKNRRAMDKHEDKPEGLFEKKEEAAGSSAVTTASPEAPVMDAAPAATDVLNPPAAVDATPSADADTGAGDDHIMDLTQDEIHQAIEMLTNKLERLKSSKKLATLVMKEIKDRREQGEMGKDLGSYSPAKDPQASSEVVSASEPADKRDQGAKGDGKYAPAPSPMKPGSMKSEEPKGHKDAGTSTGGTYAPAKVKAGREDEMLKTAAEKDPLWSVNQKELEKLPAAKKPAQAAPTDVSWDTKEMASEQMKLDKGGNAGSAVKKYFGRLPSGGLGEAPKSIDLKSQKDPEKDVLRKRAEEAEKETARLQEKEKLTQVADKIYEIVKALRERNVLTAEKEDEVINLLGSSFKDLAGLDAVLGLVTRLATVEPVSATPEPAESISGGVPQVFEPISETEDAISQMSKIWNL